MPPLLCCSWALVLLSIALSSPALRLQAPPAGLQVPAMLVLRQVFVESRPLGGGWRSGFGAVFLPLLEEGKDSFLVVGLPSASLEESEFTFPVSVDVARAVQPARLGRDLFLSRGRSVVDAADAEPQELVVPLRPPPTRLRTSQRGVGVDRFEPLALALGRFLSRTSEVWALRLSLLLPLRLLMWMLRGRLQSALQLRPRLGVPAAPNHGLHGECMHVLLLRSLPCNTTACLQ